MHLKYGSTPFLLLPRRQIQCSVRDGKSNIYFHQDMQDFGGANCTRVQGMKQKSSNNIHLRNSFGKEKWSMLELRFERTLSHNDQDCDNPLGKLRSNRIDRSLGASATRSPASKLADDRECTVSMARYLSFMEWKIFDCKQAKNMKTKRKNPLPEKLYCRRKI